PGRHFNDLLTALHHDNSLVIDLEARDNAVPILDAKKLPAELRSYREEKMRTLVAENPEIYAGDIRTIEVQTDERKLSSIVSFVSWLRWQALALTLRDADFVIDLL